MENNKYMRTDLYDIIRIDKDILLIPFNGNDNTKKAILLNEISAIIFNCIENGKTFQEIVDQLFEQYDVEIDRLKDDTLNCIDKLLSLNAIKPS